MSFFGRSAALVVFAGLAAACGEKVVAPQLGALGMSKDVPTDRLATLGEAFTPKKCPYLPLDYGIQCGSVEVPEEKGSARSVEVFVVRVFTKKKAPVGEPVVYLEGGPGAAVSDSLEGAIEAFAPLLEERDLVFIDQRGTGRSLPELRCKTSDAEDELRDCYDQVVADVDLSTYRTAQIADDFEVVRKTLGYETWNLFGISYGTRLGLTIVRDHPKSVRAAIFDSVVPVEIDLLGNLGKNGYSAFSRVFSACAADAKCHTKYPDPEKELLETAARLTETPEDLGSGSLDGNGFVHFLFQFLYSASLIELMPQIIHDAYTGDLSLFEELSTAVTKSQGGFSFGMHLSVQCAEEMPFTSASEITRLDEDVPVEVREGLSGAYYVDYCESWPVPAAPALENEAVESSVPGLFFGGYFDPITPSAYAEQAAAHFGQGSYFEVKNGSHGASVNSCGLSMINEFLDDPSRPPSAACLSEIGDLSFKAKTRVAKGGFSVPLRFRTEKPSDEEVEELKEDLKRRLSLGGAAENSRR